MPDFIKNLNELNENSLPEAGGKGANLGVLINAGLPGSYWFYGNSLRVPHPS